MNKEQRRRVCELIAGLIATDGVLHEAEKALLRRAIDRLGAGDEAVVVMPMLSSAEAKKAIADLPEDVRREALDQLIEAAIVDGVVDPSEHQYLRAVAAAAGVRDDELELRIVERLAEHAL